MRHYEAKDVGWYPMEIKGIQGFFSDMRIKSQELVSKDGWRFSPEWYELADCSSDGEPCRYSRQIIVDFYGTFISIDKLPWDETKDGYKPQGYINNRSEWGFTDGIYTYDEMMDELKSMKEEKFNKVQEESNHEETEN